MPSYYKYCFQISIMLYIELLLQVNPLVASLCFINPCFLNTSDIKYIPFLNHLCFQVLNQIVLELPSAHPLADTRPLRELLGHTPPEVCIPNLLENPYWCIMLKSFKQHNILHVILYCIFKRALG
jgi:hypothetical protein